MLICKTERRNGLGGGRGRCSAKEKEEGSVRRGVRYRGGGDGSGKGRGLKFKKKGAEVVRGATDWEVCSARVPTKAGPANWLWRGVGD